MPTYGGFSPQPERYGGSNDRLRRIVEALNAGRGTGLDTTQPSPVYAENMAFARAIDGAWSTSRRVAYCTDMMRTQLLSRWETILAKPPLPDDDETTRRARCAAVFARVGVVPTFAAISAQLAAAMGGVFVALTTIPLSSAQIFWPAGTTNAATPWMSTVAHLLVEVQTVGNMTDGQFYDDVKGVHTTLDGFVAAHITWDWYRADAVHGVLGFWLDSDHNLDNSVFDT